MNNDILEMEYQLQKESDLHQEGSLRKRIDLMNALAWDIRRVNSEQSLSLCREAYRLSEEAGYDTGFAESYLCMAIHDGYADNHDEALRKCRRVQQIFESQNHTDGRIKVYNSFGYSYSKLGKYDKALEAFMNGLTLARETGNTNMTVFFLNNIGEIYKDTINMYDEALKYYFEAAELCENSNISIYGIILSSIGECYDKLGESEKALEYSIKGLIKAQESEDKTAMAYCFNVLGKTYNKMGDIDKALENLEMSLAYRKEMPPPLGR